MDDHPAHLRCLNDRTRTLLRASSRRCTGNSNPRQCPYPAQSHWGIQYVQDHVIHFYHLHALDWVDIVSALDADPQETSKLAQSISDWPKSSTDYFKGMKDKLAAYVNSGQLGPFANAYWGHPAYKLPPAANLMAVALYLEALEWQRDVIRAHALLGGKNPHLQTYLVGGMSTPLDPDSQWAINADTIAQLQKLFQRAKDFVHQVYLPDLLTVAPAYLDWAEIGEGTGNFLSYGDFPDRNGEYWLPRGYILDRNLSKVNALDHTHISEHVTHSWYEYGDESRGLHPWDGETNPNYTCPNPPYEFLNTDDKYTWMKAPRLVENAMEVGPLSRNLVAYANGHQQVQGVVDSVLGKLGAGPEVLFSTLCRTAARCIETVVTADKLMEWTHELAGNVGSGDLDIHAGRGWNPDSWPSEAMGWGSTDAPRGALGHWIHIKAKKIQNYQAIVPSTWNSSPRDAHSVPGPYEASLIGTPVADPEMPVEILRTIHSFDPCMTCGVHLLDPQGRQVNQVTTRPTSSYTGPLQTLHGRG